MTFKILKVNHYQQLTKVLPTKLTIRPRFSNGESIIYDAQTGALLQLEKIIKGANINNGIKILRVDNLLVNNDIINKVVRLKKS